ncbi:MAG: hypothetical protein DMF50_01765 [Acidobacteria bacterium]|nr:MAG: hypothetical protein DMF50_01765 [Acidobacteriota bacterium]
MVTVAAPGSVLPPPSTSVAAAPVVRFQRWVCPAPTARGAPLPGAAMVSTTTSPAALVTLTVGIALLPLADTKAPSGVVWSTPVYETAPPTIRFAAESVTTMLAVPVGGAINLHISMRSVFAPAVWPPIRVRACPE